MTPLRLLTLALLLTAATAPAQTFKTEKLRRAAAVAGINAQLTAIEAGQTVTVSNAGGQPFSVRMAPTGREVEHIGIPLFTGEMRTLQPSPVYDFLEYAVLNIIYKVNPNQLYLNKVVFRKGNWQTLAESRLDECPCTISNQDDRLYIVSWQRDTATVAEVGIPIDYELLGNDTRRNMERDFIRHLQNHHPSPATHHPSPTIVDEADLKIYGTQGLFVLEGDTYMLDNLSQNRYYELTTVRETADTVISGEHVTMTMAAVLPMPVVSADHPAETLANLLLGGDSRLPDALLTLDFHLSDYHRQQLAVPVSRFADFCRQQGCQTFFASRGTVAATTEEDTAGKASSEEEGTLFITNPGLGYCHLLSVSTPLDQLTQPQPRVTANVYLYIPPIEKTKLFSTPPARKSGAKIRQ